MSKFCTRCGSEVNDNAVVCVKCGCSIQQTSNSQKTIQNNTSVTENAENKVQVSLFLGIAGIVFAFLLAIIGHICSIIGIIVGIKEYRKSGKMTGLTLSIIGEVCAIISSIIGAVAMSGAF